MNRTQQQHFNPGARPMPPASQPARRLITTLCLSMAMVIALPGAARAQCTGDVIGDDFASAEEFLGCVDGAPSAIDCIGDADMYWWVAPTSGTYVFQTYGTTDTFLDLFDASQVELAFDDDSGSGTNARISYAVVAGQLYYLQVSEYGNDAVGSYNLSITGCGASGCGSDPGDDTFDAASSLRSGCGSLSDRAIDCPGDVDVYSWTASSSGTRVFSVSPSGSVMLVLYSSAGSRLDEGSTVHRDVSSGESFYIAVSSRSASDAPSYTLDISGCSSGGCGSDPGNDTTGTATNLGSSCGTTAAAVDCPGDVDFYSFTAPNSGTFTFDVSTTAIYDLRLFDSAGNLLEGPSSSAVSHSLTAGQQVFVFVQAAYSSDYFGYDLIISGCSSGGCGSDPGNDTAGTATSLGSTCGSTSGRIDCTGDVDFYSFTAPNSGTFTFDVSALSAYNITLYSDTGSLLEGPSGSALSHSLSSGQLVYVRVMAANDGALLDYAVVVSGCSSGGCGSDPGNDYLAEATPLSGCGTTSAAIDCAGDLDYYSLTAPNSGSFTFETTGSIDTELRLYDANGDAIASDDDSGSGSNARIVHTLTGGQKYSIAVNEYGNNGTGSYDLVISGCSSGSCGSDPGNDSIATATDLGSSCGTTQASLECGSDLDYYRFVAPNDGSFTFSASSGPGNYVYLLDQTGAVLYQAGTSITYTLSAGSTYYFEVAPLSTTDPPFDYQLTISGCSSGGCGSDPGDNDAASATVFPSCGSYSAAIDCPGDEDHYSFTPPAGATYTFLLTAGFQTLLELRDPSGQVVMQDGVTFDFPLVTGSGAYDVVVRAPGGDIGSYTLEITGCTGDTCPSDIEGDTVLDATPVAGCGSTQHAIDCPGDVDMFFMTAPATGTYTIETLGSTDTVAGIDLGGNWVVDDDSGEGLNARLVVSLVENTTYSFSVQGYNQISGPYTLSISGCSEPDTGMVYFVPATAKLSGAAGTDWRSDLALVNTGSSSSQITVEAWLRDQSNPAPATASLQLAPGQALNQADVLASLLGLPNGSAAALRIVSTQPLAVASRTYNQTGSGTYGQYIAGELDLLATPPGETVYLIGLQEDSAARTNLGILNLGDTANHVTVSFFSADGSALGAPVTYTVPANGSIQRNRVLNDVSSGPVSLAWASLSSADAPFMAYASVIDEVSGDPVYRPATPSFKDTVEMTLSGLAKVSGAAGTNWVSDLVAVNTGAASTNASLELWVRNQDNGSPSHRSIDLPAGNGVRFGDVLPSLFGMGGGAATVRVAAPAGVLLDARTFNLVGSSTYGQYLPAILPYQAVDAQAPGYFLMVSQNSSYRTNLGLVNTGGVAADVTVTLHDASGSAIGSPQSFHLEPAAYTQVDRIAQRFTSAEVDGAYLMVEVAGAPAGAEVTPYLTVVDQRTGDPIYQLRALTAP